MIERANFIKRENFALSLLLYGVVLLYTYQFIQIAWKYQPFTADEFFYYVEAKAISAHNIYQTPASLDGNTSYIGDFGFHGVSYAIKDGWLSKLFFHSSEPTLVWNNFLTCLLLIIFILFFKPFNLNLRLKISLIIATHYILFSFTLSYMQETIHYFFAVLALRNLYKLYSTKGEEQKKYLVYYLIIIIIAMTFRYGWFIWGLGLLPLSVNLKSFIKWGSIALLLLLFGLLISRYIAAPYPYDQMIADRLIRSENFSIIDSLQIVFGELFNNIKLFIKPSGKTDTTVMRYLLLTLLSINTWYAFTKKNKFIIASTIIGWGYFFSALGFYHAYWAYDERAMAILNPVLAFSIVGVNNKNFFYPILALQLYLLPGIVKDTHNRNFDSINVNASAADHQLIESSFSKLKEIITDDQTVVVAADINLVRHGALNYFTNFPLVNCKGHSIHYRFYRDGTDLRGTHIPQYLLNPSQSSISINSKLIYSDSWVRLYKIL